MTIKPEVIFLLLLALIAGLLFVIGFWRRKAGEAAYAAARNAERKDDRDHHCRLAVMAGHRDACCMFCCLHPGLFEDRKPLKPFRSRGIRMVFYGYITRHAIMEAY